MESRIDMNLGISGEPDSWVHSACLLCSNGCGMDIAVKDGRIVGVRGQPNHPVNFGHLGPKGEHAWIANQSKSRGTVPMIRRTKGGDMEEASWNEALDFFMEKFELARAKSHENIGCYNSGQLTLEEFYTLGKLWRGGLQSSNIDGNTRLCTATSATGLMTNFGADGPVAGYVDIDAAELLCLYGHNVAETQTVLWERMLAAKKQNNARIIVFDPRKTPTVRQGADLHLQVKLGTNVALMNGIIYLLIENGAVDQAFVDEHTVGFAKLQEVAGEYPPERVSAICGIAVEDLKTAAEWIGSTKRMVSTVLQGFYQSVQATAASSLVNTVHLLRGAIGRPGAGPLLMAGQPSAMCNRETGAGGSFPAYRNPQTPQHMAELCKLWNLNPDDFHPEKPKDILTMMEIAERGEIEFLWVVGTNPIVSLPDQNRTAKILEKLFVVVQDPFVDMETLAFADLYLPAAMWGEKTGCITNADRSVNLLLKAIEPPGEARADLDIFIELARRMGLKDRDGNDFIPFRNSGEAFDEWRAVSKGRPCDYSGMSYELILQHGAIRWPCNDEHPLGTERLYEDLRFWTGIDDCESFGFDFLNESHVSRTEYEKIDPKGKAFLRPARWRMQPNPPTEAFPFVISTGRVVYHFHTRTKTARSEELNRRVPHAYVEIHPEDAERLNISTGDTAEVISPKGNWIGLAMVVDTVRPGELFIPFHFGMGTQAANQHTWYARDPVSMQPQLKSSPGQIRRKDFGTPEQWLLDRRAELTGESNVPFATRTLGRTVNIPATHQH